jgi:hypothetical protein
MLIQHGVFINGHESRIGVAGTGMVQSMEHESGTFELLEIGMKSPQQEGEI